jgi:predicted ATP-grasp superfamily ATP-dependent carboligase
VTSPVAVVYPDNLAALGVCRGLGAHGVRSVVLSTDATAPGQYSRYVRRLACPPIADEASFVAFLAATGRAQAERPVLFLTDDSSLFVANRHRPLLDECYRFPHASWVVLERILMKDELYRSLEGVVPVPRTAVPADESALAAVAGQVGFPAVLKPVLRCLSESEDPGAPPFEKIFGAKAVRVRTGAELTRAYREARARGFRVVVQEEIEGPISALRSVGLYATPDEVVAAFTSQKLGQVPADFGDGLIVQAIWDPDLVPLAARAVRHFGYHGMADIEFKWDARAGAYKLLDINPRPWLWINLPTVCGVNLPYAAYLGALGRALDRGAFVQRDFRTRWISGRGLVVHLVRSLGAGRPHDTLRTLAAHFRGPRVGPLLSRDDLLYRMFMSPRYWRESFRQLAHGLQNPSTASQAR